jgi:glycyl-tRNA synthetase beta subunit
VTTTNNEEYDLLISELFAEAHGLRMKYEEFSQYTEAKIAEFVLEPIAIQLEQLSRDLAVTNAQRAQIHADLVALTARIDNLTAQRDNARLRVKTLESARSYRIAKKLRRLVPNFFQGK